MPTIAPFRLFRNVNSNYVPSNTTPEHTGQYSYLVLPRGGDQPADQPTIHRDVTVALRGFHHLHTFALEAEFFQSSAIVQWFLRHCVDGREVERFGWGHGSMGAYKSLTLTSFGDAKWSTSHLSSRAVQHDLPCCGGTYQMDQDFGAYVSAHCGHCAQCRMPFHFDDHVSFRVDLAGSD